MLHLSSKKGLYILFKIPLLFIAILAILALIPFVYINLTKAIQVGFVPVPRGGLCNLTAFLLREYVLFSSTILLQLSKNLTVFGYVIH